MSYPHVQKDPAPLGSGSNRPISRAWHTANPQATSPRKPAAARGPRGVWPRARKSPTHEHKSEYYRTAALDAQVVSGLAGPPRKEPEYQVNIVEILGLPHSQPQFVPVAKYEESTATYQAGLSPIESPAEVEQQLEPEDQVEHVLWAGSDPQAVPPTNAVPYHPLGHTAAVLSSSTTTTWETFDSHLVFPGFSALPTPPYGHGGNPQLPFSVPQHNSIDSFLRDSHEVNYFSSSLVDSTSSFCQAWPMGPPQNTGQFDHPEAEQPSAATTDPFAHAQSSSSASFVEAHGLPASVPQPSPAGSFGHYAMQDGPTPVFHHSQLHDASSLSPLAEVSSTSSAAAEVVPMPFSDSRLALSSEEAVAAFAASQPEYAAGGGAWTTSWGQDMYGQNVPAWYHQPGIKNEENNNNSNNDLDVPTGFPGPGHGHLSQHGPPPFSEQQQQSGGGFLSFHHQPWTGAGSQLALALAFPPAFVEEASVVREPSGVAEASHASHAQHTNPGSEIAQRPHGGHAGVIVVPQPNVMGHGENSILFHDSVEASRQQIFPKPDPDMAQAQALPTSDEEALRLCVPSRQVEQQQQQQQQQQRGVTKLSTPEGALKPRKPFLEDDRKETSRTRDIGACVRCKMQRVRCRPNPSDPDGPCLGCFKVAHNKSRKVIHHIGCHRYKLQEITLFRSAATQVTGRWQGSQVRDIPTVGEASHVRLVQGAGEDLWIHIAKFTPKPGVDRTARIFCPPEDLGETRAIVEPVGAYALVNVQRAREEYKAYLARNWYREFARTCRDEMKADPAGLVSRVYGLAQAHHDSLPVAPNWDFYRPSGESTWDPKSLPEKSFLAGTLLMCFVLRQAVGYSWIESLDVEAKGLEMEQHRLFTPLRGRYGAPRLVVAQIDCIRITCVLRSLAKPLLKVLTTWIAERRHGCWLSIFFASFVFLREISVATRDAYEHGRFNPKYRKLEDPIQPNHPTVISEMHESANIILAHWHYFNCSVDPETLEDKARAKSPLRELTAEQFETVKGVWQKARLRRTEVDAESQQRDESHETRPAWDSDDQYPVWCDPLYFAEQMFDSDWRPRKVFTGQGIDWKKVQKSDDETRS